MRKGIIAGLCVGVVVGLLIQRKIGPEVEPTPAAVRPAFKAEPLPEVARLAVHKIMRSHGKSMRDLLDAVFRLDIGATKLAAQKISDEPSMARAVHGDATEAAAAVPDSFFALQDQLKVRARAVRMAADSGDRPELAATVGELIETCVQCHTAHMPFHRSGDLVRPNEAADGGADL